MPALRLQGFADKFLLWLTVKRNWRIIKNSVLSNVNGRLDVSQSVFGSAGISKSPHKNGRSLYTRAALATDVTSTFEGYQARISGAATRPFHGISVQAASEILPGKPDLVLPSHRAVIFVHGCFWHRHPRCRKASIPSTRVDFWADKFRRNISRDLKNYALLRQANGAFS
jgi:DNA mismatch endonuclease Vsr